MFRLAAATRPHGTKAIPQNAQRTRRVPPVFRRGILQTKTTNAGDILQEVAELASTSSGAQSLARELGEDGGEALRVLRQALVRVRMSSGNNNGGAAPVSARELRLVALEAGVPFIGFGLIDNSGMIVFGDAIDQSFGVVFGVSTLASAALGNMVSDILGIGLGGVVAHAAGKLGLPTATLTLEQTMSKSVRRARTIGCTIGVIIGCCLGMFPLLLLDDQKAERLKRQKRLDELFVKAVRYIAKDVLHAESGTLFVLDPSTNELWTRASKELSKDVRFPVDKGIAGRCARTGSQIFVEDAYKDPDFNKDVDRAHRTHTKSLLCTPIFDSEGKVCGVLEVINKRDGMFNEDDARALAAAASHVSMAMDEVAKQRGWLENVESSNPLLDALKTHHHNYIRFHSEHAKN